MPEETREQGNCDARTVKENVLNYPFPGFSTRTGQGSKSFHRAGQYSVLCMQNADAYAALPQRHACITILFYYCHRVDNHTQNRLIIYAAGLGYSYTEYKSTNYIPKMEEMSTSWYF